MTTPTKRSRGTALLAVLWLSAALGAIAMSLADTVRGEAERSATAVDSLRSQDLAIGGLRRAILYMDWGRAHPDIPRFKPLVPFYLLDFPEGQVRVDVVPENAKININNAPPDLLFRLFVNLGVDAGRAQELAAAIVDWRGGALNAGSPFDAFYATQRPPYVAPHARFQEIEELLAVKDVTPDLYYGSWQNAPEGSAQRLVQRAGLVDCLSVYGAVNQFDANNVSPAVLAAVGVPPEGVAAIVQRRRAQPFLNATDLGDVSQIAGPGFVHLRVGGLSIFTLRATARIRLANGQLSDLRRSVGAMVKFLPSGWDTSYHILRWYDSPLSTPSDLFPDVLK